MYQYLARAVFGTQEKIRSSKISQSKSTWCILLPVTAVPLILLVGFSGLQSAGMSTAAPETTTVPRTLLLLTMCAGCNWSLLAAL